jgi:DNA-binding CsgD family transcriptional regulator
MVPAAVSDEPRELRELHGLVPLLAVSGVIVLVVFGQSHGMWLSNVHNGLLAVAFTLVGAYISFQRPGHREGRLFLATGVVEALMFYGRQVGHTQTTGAGRWLGWFGVWPVAIALALMTVSVICFPDGRLPSLRWKPVVVAVVVLAVVCATVSAIWPVEYESVRVVTPHPINGNAPTFVAGVWSAVAHSAYVWFQVLWVIAIASRWRAARGHVRFQLACLAIASAVSVAALVVGLALWQTARPGILTATLVPIAAGWAIVQGQHLAAYSALSWLSRVGADGKDLPLELATTVANALDAPSATLWIGTDTLRAVGVWPETDRRIDPTSPADLGHSPNCHIRAVTKAGRTIGAITVERKRANTLSAAERRLFDDLASHASFVIEHMGLADLGPEALAGGHLSAFSAREREVLELMARGLSNASICQELHLSVKTIEPTISSIFTKLGLHNDSRSNRRVLAVLAFLRT